MIGSFIVGVVLAVTPNTRDAFGREMRAQRGRRTLREVATAMAERGDPVTQAALSAYERGQYAPPPSRVRLLDEVLGAEGALVDAFGLSPTAPSSTTQRLDQLELAVEAMGRYFGLRIGELVAAYEAALQRATGGVGGKLDNELRHEIINRWLLDNVFDDDGKIVSLPSAADTGTPPPDAEGPHRRGPQPQPGQDPDEPA